MHPWKEHQGAIPTGEEIEKQWRAYPLGNVGCVLGQVSRVVRVDVDGATGEDALQEWSEGDTPDTWEFRSSAEGRGLLYRWDQGTPCQTVIKSSADGAHTELRLMGNGSQTVLPPSRHESGSIYTWVPGHSPDELPLAPAPAWLVARMTAVPHPARPAQVPHDAPIYEYAAELLRWVPNPGADRDTWRNIGMALHSTGADWAFEAWDTWSQQYPEKYDGFDQAKAWNSFSLAGPAGKAPITFGTLVHLAKAHGYQRRNGETPGPGTDARPVIRIGPDITRMIDEGQTALLALPGGPVLFQRARRLSIIARGVKPPAWLHRPADAPIIIEAQAAYLDELATLAARWEKFDRRARKGEEWVEVTPPGRFAQTLQARPSWPFPLLEGIIHSPTLRPDGSLLNRPGYDESTGLYLDFGDTAFPAVPVSPTFDDARSALGRLAEVFKDFLWALRDGHTGTTNPYLSATIAAVLTLVGRHAVAGNVPLIGVTSTAAGSGKGLLVDVISRIGTGRYAPKMGQTLDDNEELKRLLALALEGVSLCCIDNVTHPLGNQYLDMAVTAQAITGRILGQTQTAEAPWHALLFATGNNLSYRGDMTRRVLPIALDPQMEKPEERSGFAHPDLEAWVQQHRPQLVVSALTILRAYFVAGSPAQGLTPWGSFQPWSDLVRNAVVWLGEADPCEGRQDLAAHTDESYERLGSLLSAWEACYPPKPDGALQSKTLQQVKQDISLYAANKDQVPTTWDHLRDVLVEFDKRYDGKSLNTHLIGNALRTIDGRVIDQKRLKRCGIDRRQSLWRVERL